MPRNRSALATLLSTLALALSPVPLPAQEVQEQEIATPEAAPLPQQDLEQQEDDGFFGLGWLDQTQAASSNQANALARRIDRYFGVERSDLEAAYSSLRLITQTSWDHADGSDFRVSLRGTVHLPRLNERLRLVFSDDRGEGTTYYNQNNMITQQSSTRANLEVNLGESDYSRFDFRVGLRSNLKLRTSVRWRYERPFAENYVTRLSQTLYFIDSTGYGSFTQLQFDRNLTENTLLRWSSEFRAQEDLHGNEWASALEYTVLGQNSGGISYFLRLTGNSAHPDVDTYQIGFRLRQNILRPWLFWELTPGYSWVKQVPELPEDPWQPYQSGFFAAVRLEMAIGRY